MVIVQSSGPVTLVGGAPIEKEILREALDRGHRIVAADSGAEAALAAGRQPDAVIGDFDSLSDQTRALLPPERLHHIPEQDSTDFEKALTRIAAPLVIAVGFSGARLDHELAVFSTLLRVPAPPCVILRGGELAFLAPTALRLPLPSGSDIGFFPLRAVETTTRGVKWPVNQAVMAPGGLISTSNKALGEVHLETDRPGVIVTVPATALDTVMQVLAAPDAARAG